jgi:hypothetical protein
MALIDELKEKREVWLCNVALHDQRVVDECLNASRARDMVADLDRAIAALEPAPADEPQPIPDEPELFDDEPREYISELTGDPCIEPESGLHGEPVEEAPAPQLQSGYDLYAEHLAAVAAMDEAPALNAQMQDEREQGYAPVTNPDADFWARGLTGEQKPERKHNPFSIFRRETEEV